MRRYRFSPSKTIFMAGYRELENIRHSEGGTLQGEELQLYFERYGLQAIERAIQKGFNEANIQMDKFLSLLASIGSVSPFVGLFGTVCGYYGFFYGISFGGGYTRCNCSGYCGGFGCNCGRIGCSDTGGLVL